MVTDEPTDTSYFNLVPEEWRNDPSITGAVVRGYSSGIAEFADLSGPAIEAVRSLASPIAGKFALVFMSLEKEEPQLVFDEIVTFHADEMRMNLSVRRGAVPAGHYACLALPVYDNDEAYVTRRGESIRGLLTLVAGHSAMLDLAFEQRFDLTDPDRVSRVSMVAESHIHPNHWRVFSAGTLQAVHDAFADTTDEFRSRAELAFSFIARSANVADHTARYSNTWIALEIAAGGHKALRTFLNGLDPNFGDEAKRFFDTRNALFHHGLRPIFDQDDERFLCACVLELILRNFGIADPLFGELVEHQLARRSRRPADLGKLPQAASQEV